MKTILLSFSLLVAVFQTAFSQKITGSVEAAGKPADFATVLLKAAKDSSLVRGTVTGENGTYDFPGIEPGMYFIEASSLGLGKGASRAFEYKGGTFAVDGIELTETSKEISEVVVVARRPPVEVKADKTILNVEGTVNSTGLNALELLRKAPGVTVDNNENVQVKGKNAVKIMIDGRDVPLDGKDLSALLKGTQAADIANIEIISNPSAKYDASGNAGIINIKLKKNKALGTNGNIGLEGVYGETAKGGLNASLNNRSKNVNVFGSFNNHYGDWHNTNDFVRTQNGTQFDQRAKDIWMSRWSSARAGADWSLNSKHTVGVLANGSYNHGGWESKSRTQISQTATVSNIDSLLVATNTQDLTHTNYNFNVNYRFADTSGHSLNIDIDRGFYRNRSNSFQPNDYRSTDNAERINYLLYKNNTPTDIDITTAKADYEQNLLKGVLGVGFKIANVETDNTFDFFNVINGQDDLDENRSNRFVYEERTTAGYVNYNRKFGKKLNLQAGLRLENTDYMGDLQTYNNTDSTVEATYTKLFPSAAVTYSFTDKIGLNATYSRRIDRPSYQDLNPFENKLDELTYQRGNPRLRPQFTNSFEIAPTYQGYPVLSLGYSHTNDVFTQVLGIDPDNPRAAFMTNENLADQKNWTLSLNAPTPITKWWDGFISLTGFRSHFEARFDDGFSEPFEIDQAFSAFNGYCEQNIKLPKGFGLQVSGWYNSASFWGTMRAKPQGAMDVGLQKKLWDGKGEMRLRVGDVLGTAGWRGENVFTPGLVFIGRGTWESQTVTLNFSYRFGSSEVKAARQRKTGLDEESRRVKGGKG
ncbi:MAG: TonB-dependent receptor domain-containing protein [Saprospiraceae bacterium]